LFNPPYFTGAGQKLQLNVGVGTLEQTYELNFTEPWLLGKRLMFNIDLFHRVDYFSSLNGDYNETFDGGTLSLTKALGSQFLRGTVSYTMQDVHLAINPGYEPYRTTNYFSNPGTLYEQESYNAPDVTTNILAERGSYFESKLGAVVNFNTLNSYKLPNAGQNTSLSAQVATPPGGTEFYKLELRTSWFFKGLATNHVLEIDARGGAVATWGHTDDVPIFERYTLGGMYSLRGYRFETVGPRDSLGEALGGDTYWFSSVEYSIPIVSMVRYAFFYDIGNVYQDSFSFKTEPGHHFFQDDVGIGLRIVLPIGGGTPLRLDYGVPITHDPGPSKWGRFQFGFGYSHPF
jgi:outer membrane protein insertion porin family